MSRETDNASPQSTDFDARGREYLTVAVRERNATGEDTINEEETETLYASYQLSTDEEKEACLDMSPEDFLQFVELVRDSVKFANEAAELLRLTQEAARRAYEAKGMSESEIAQRLDPKNLRMFNERTAISIPS